MALFSVLLNGHPVQMHFADRVEPVCYGFYKNNYVFAANDAAAIRAAKTRVLEQLVHHQEITAFNESDLVLTVDEINPSWAFWRLWRQQGFIFYEA